MLAWASSRKPWGDALVRYREFEETDSRGYDQLNLNDSRRLLALCINTSNGQGVVC